MVLISHAGTPTSAAMVAAPIRKEWLMNLLEFAKPVSVSARWMCWVKTARVSGVPEVNLNSGVSAGRLLLLRVASR